MTDEPKVKKLLVRANNPIPPLVTKAAASPTETTIIGVTGPPDTLGNNPIPPKPKPTPGDKPATTKK